MTKKYPPHPAALLMPRPTEAEYAALEESILTNREIFDPIELFEGMVLDGITRQDIGFKHGLEMSSNYLPLTPHDLGPKQCPYEYVRAKHTRRNLTPSQWATVAIELKAKSKIGKNAEKLNQEKAATLVGVSPRLVGMAATVKKLGCKEAFEAVKEGKAKVGEMEQFVKAEPDKKKQAEILRSANAKEEVKQRISGGTSFDVSELEGAPQEGERKRKNGAPVIGTKTRRECLALHAKLCRALNAIGIYEEFIQSLSQIATRIKEL